MPKLPNPETIILESGFITYTFYDPFQMFHYYLNAHPQCKIKELATVYLKDIIMNLPDFYKKNKFFAPDFLREYKVLCDTYQSVPNSLCFIIEDKFIHFAESRVESNFHHQQTNLIKKYLFDLIFG